MAWIHSQVLTGACVTLRRLPGPILPSVPPTPLGGIPCTARYLHGGYLPIFKNARARFLREFRRDLQIDVPKKRGDTLAGGVLSSTPYPMRGYLTCHGVPPKATSPFAAGWWAGIYPNISVSWQPIRPGRNTRRPLFRGYSLYGA